MFKDMNKMEIAGYLRMEHWNLVNHSFVGKNRIILNKPQYIIKK